MVWFDRTLTRKARSQDKTGRRKGRSIPAPVTYMVLLSHGVPMCRVNPFWGHSVPTAQAWYDHQNLLRLRFIWFDLVGVIKSVEVKRLEIVPKRSLPSGVKSKKCQKRCTTRAIESVSGHWKVSRVVITLTTFNAVSRQVIILLLSTGSRFGSNVYPYPHPLTTHIYAAYPFPFNKQLGLLYIGTCGSTGSTIIPV